MAYGSSSDLPKLYDIFLCEVGRLEAYGVFVKIPGYKKNGLVHKSQMSNTRLEHPEDMVANGDRVYCKVISVDDEGKIGMSMKVVNQTSGQDLDPNHIQASLDEQRRRTGHVRETRRINLGAVLDTTCSKCGGKGHFAQDCFHIPGATTYELLPDIDYMRQQQEAEQSKKMEKGHEHHKKKKKKSSKKHKKRKYSSSSSDSEVETKAKKSKKDRHEKSKLKEAAHESHSHSSGFEKHRRFSTISLEVAQASHEYLSERMHPEQEDIIKDMKELVMSRNLGSFVKHGVRVVRRLFPDEASDFTDGAAEQWENMMNVPFLPDGCDLGCKMTVRLRQLLPVTTGSVQKVLASLACMSPHYMQTKRIVSHHNLVVDNHRTSMGENTRNARLMVALNGVDTAYFDPRPAVVKFLEKTRRSGAPDWDIYG
ncbi:Nucleolar protein of 40 kDa [Lamellibrachia satsuma]|nr:Nucleolar protein of 40 kDa [Lamellibrachia satsuma]